MLFTNSAQKLLAVSALIAAGCADSPPSADLPTSLKISDEIVMLSTDEGRNISTRVLTPDGCMDCPLVIFSHGANAAYDRYDALVVPLAQAGYRVAIPNHTDSEDHFERAAYTPTDWLPTRVEDYNIIAEQYDTSFRIAAGHSFGAMIAQIAGGAEMSSDIKIDPEYLPGAVLAYSPPGPIPNYIDSEGWSKMKVPSLITTGTKDIVPMMADQWELHLASHEAAPLGTSFALIYANMDHYMNGAYGRETQASTSERERALKHMIGASVFFVSELRKDGRLSSKDWDTQEQNFVEARARK